jgi:hypothetical protein
MSDRVNCNTNQEGCEVAEITLWPSKSKFRKAHELKAKFNIPLTEIDVVPVLNTTVSRRIVNCIQWLDYCPLIGHTPRLLLVSLLDITP